MVNERDILGTQVWLLLFLGCSVFFFWGAATGRASLRGHAGL